MQPNMTPTYEAPDFKSPVGVSHAPEITPQNAARGLGSKFPYSGGAMAMHNPKALAQPTHSYATGMAGSHVVHDPRFVG